MTHGEKPSERVEVRDGKEFKVTVLPEAKPPKNRSAKTRFHHAEVGKPGEVGGAGHVLPEPGGRSRAAKRAWAKRRKS